MLSVKAKYENGKIIFNDKITFSEPHDVIVTFLDDEETTYQLSGAGKELLKRKELVDNGKAEILSEDEFFKNV